MGHTTATAHEVAAMKARARELFIEAGGNISAKTLSKRLAEDGLKVSANTCNRWRAVGKWEIALAPVESSAMQRAVRSRELQDLITERGGETIIFEGVYGEMLLGASTVAAKLLAWAERVDVKKLAPDEALAMMKALPALVDKTLGLKDKLSDLRFRGARDTDMSSNDTTGAINGEILPPKAVQAAPPAPHPALAEALETVLKAKKVAPTIAKDVAPKTRSTMRT